MTIKQKDALERIISALPNDCQSSFREVAEHAISLGYMPVTRGANATYADFVKSKIKRTILKIDLNTNPPRLGMKFYAIPEYFGIFGAAIEERVTYYSKLNYEITAHCTGCMHSESGKCKGAQGYTFKFSDGRQGFLCGFCVISLPSFSAENVAEVKQALTLQDDYFIKQI
jgi:hypothetical protein